MKSLTILYDAGCGFCCRCRAWLESRDQIIPLRFIPLDSREAARRFGDLQRLRPGEQMLAISDAGEVWQGDAAWVMCLHALRDYRPLAEKFAHPLFRPFVKQAYRLVSSNRHQLSDLLGLSPQVLARENQGQTPQVGCRTGGCPL